MNTSTCFANHVSEEVVYAQYISLPTEEDKDRLILSLKERLEFLENKNKTLKEENTTLKHRLIASLEHLLEYKIENKEA